MLSAKDRGYTPKQHRGLLQHVCVYAKQNKKEEAVGSLKQARYKEFKD